MMKFFTVLLANAAWIGSGHSMDKESLENSKNTPQSQVALPHRSIKGKPRSSFWKYQHSYRRWDGLNLPNNKDWETKEDYIRSYVKRCNALNGKTGESLKKLPVLNLKLCLFFERNPRAWKIFIKGFHNLKEMPTQKFLHDHVNHQIPLRYLRNLQKLSSQQFFARNPQKIRRVLPKIKFFDASEQYLTEQQIQQVAQKFPNASLAVNFKNYLDTNNDVTTGNTSISDHNLISLLNPEKIRNLSLNVQDPQTLSTLNLKDFKNLKELSLQAENLTRKSFQPLANDFVETLTIRDLSSKTSEADPLSLELLEFFPNLKEFSFEAPFYSASFSDFFKKITHPIALTGFDNLSALKNLEKLEIQPPIELDQKMTDTLLNLKKLKSLSLWLDDSADQNAARSLKEFGPKLLEGLELSSLELSAHKKTSEKAAFSLEGFRNFLAHSKNTIAFSSSSDYPIVQVKPQKGEEILQKERFFDSYVYSNKLGRLEFDGRKLKIGGYEISKATFYRKK